ncbi:hypothetical protein HanRHA438_Chr02g0082941 [Helianthus annuus]|nr:hypothetical protein HanRHA438_Chr02g0082941 [Helianthus annuus]
MGQFNLTHFDMYQKTKFLCIQNVKKKIYYLLPTLRKLESTWPFQAFQCLEINNRVKDRNVMN